MMQELNTPLNISKDENIKFIIFFIGKHNRERVTRM